MSGAVLMYGLIALALFWAVGAYNRLVRLRSQAIAAFAGVDDQLKRYSDVAQAHAKAFQLAAWQEGAALWDGLRAALIQLDVSLRLARSQPLDAHAMAVLQTACDTLHAAQLRLLNAPPDLAGGQLPEALVHHWQDIARATTAACGEFNRHAASYNDAIAQFPARVLAWVFDFKPAKPLVPQP